MPSVPGPPRDVTVEIVDDFNILATWTALNPVEARGHITNYTVHYWPSCDSLQVASSTVGGNVTRYLISNLLPGVSYVVQVSANTSVGEGERSQSKKASNLINGTEVILECSTATYSTNEYGDNTLPLGVVYGIFITIILVVTAAIILLAMLLWYLNII